MTDVIAHRGASAAYRENTVEAFAGARAMGADMVELDVRRTADGTLAVHHDAHLGDGRALVDLSADDLPDWLPSLTEAFDACAPLGVNVEIKNYPADPDYDETLVLADAVAALVIDHGLHDRVLVSSFNLHDIDRVRALDPAIPTAWLTMSISDPARTVDRCLRHGHRILHPLFALVDDDLLAECRRHEVALNPWTVDDPGVMGRLIDGGVDGIITNVPDVLLNLLGRGGG